MALWDFISFRGVVRVGLAGIAALGASGYRVPASSPMPLSVPARAPLAYLAYCSERVADCFVGGGSSAGRSGVDGRSEEVDTTGLSLHGALHGPTGAGRSSEPVRSDARPARAMFKRTAAAPAPAALVAADGVIALDDQTWRLLNLVNHRVNRRIAYAEDKEIHERVDVWSLPLSEARGSSRSRVRGDCEDYALEKRRALREAGLAEEALSLAVAVLPDGNWHAVLVAATDRGDFILDNRYAWVLPWERLDYYWISRETDARADRWRFVTNASK